MRAARIALACVVIAFITLAFAVGLDDLAPQTRHFIKTAAVVVLMIGLALIMPVYEPRRSMRDEAEVIRQATLQPEFEALLRKTPVGTVFRISYVDRSKGIVRVDVKIAKGEQFALGATWSGPVFKYDVDSRERVG